MTNPKRPKAEASAPATQAGDRTAQTLKVAETALNAGVRPTDDVAVQRIEEHAAAEAAALSNVTEGAFNDGEAGLEARAADNGIVGVEERATGFKYVGVAPQRKKGDTFSPRSGAKLTGANCTITPLSALPYEAGYHVEDPASGDFYATPLSGNMDRSPSRWLDVKHPETGKPLIGEATKEGRAARRKAAGLEEE